MEDADCRFFAGLWLGRVIATDTTTGQSIGIDFFGAKGAWQIRAPRRVLEAQGAEITEQPDGFPLLVVLSPETAESLNRLLAPPRKGKLTA